MTHEDRMPTNPMSEVIHQPHLLPLFRPPTMPMQLGACARGGRLQTVWRRTAALVAALLLSSLRRTR